MIKMNESVDRLANIIFCVCGLSGFMSVSLAATTNWKRECVGRMELSFPQYADVSAHLPATLFSNMKVGDAQPKTHFIDGQEDGYTSFHVHGLMFVSHPVNKMEAERLMEAKKKSRLEAQRRNKDRPVDDFGNKRKFAFIDTPVHSTVGWRVNAAYSVMTFVGSSSILWSGGSNGSSIEKDLSDRARFFEKLLHAEPRSFGVVPEKNGLCLPYVFVSDDGSEARHIAVTYRLKSHPDITIWLQDTNGGPIPKGFDPRKFTAEYDNEFFWTLNYQEPKKYRPAWHWPPLRSIRLAGMDGRASFMELTRDDDTIDYGFFAAARGDPNKEADPTNVQMFVIRDAKNAIAKGIKPMEKDEFIKLAQTVAASVKKRPVTAARQ